MSKALVKEALDLCNDDDVPSTVKRTSFKAKSKNKPEQIFSKKGKRPVSLIEQYSKKLSHSNLDANLAFLKKISKPVGKFDLIRDAVEQSTRKPAAKKQEEEKSFFTEEDFKSFSKSYFNRPEKK